jgi:predicted ATPase/DNA-binding CsgD family transcriptional regulator
LQCTGTLGFARMGGTFDEGPGIAASTERDRIPIPMPTKHSLEHAVAPGRSPASSPLPLRQMPLPITPLIGRAHEVQQACSLLKDPGVRLLTVTGPGGVGKTRLALQVAQDLQQAFADGYCFAPLDAITTPEHAVRIMAQTLGLREIRKRLHFEDLHTFLRDKHLLLLLDNFEQLLPAAAPLLPDLLSACPKLKIVVTSRAVLRVRGEYELPVPPLSVPDLQHLPAPEALVEYGAVALFVQRAQAIKPEFRVTQDNAGIIAAICARLDGLPLALELAAAYSKLLPPGALLARLEQPLEVLTRGGPDLPVRQQTLRNTMQWSYTLLSPAEQRLFRRLAVFAGGCTLEAAEVVCTAPDEVTTPVMEGVASLLDTSLLQRVEQENEEWRLQMLETIRAYGLERLAASGELESTRHAHARYYLALAEQAEPALLYMHQRNWLERLERERGNLGAALHWLVACNETEAALRLAGALGWFWYLRGSLSEGRSLLEQALAASRPGDAPVSGQVRAKALYATGWLAFWQLDIERATLLLAESLELSRQVGATASMAAALNILGFIEHNHRGNAAAGKALLEESLRLYREVGDRAGIATVLMTLGLQAHYRGEFARVHELCGESLTLFRALGDAWHIAVVLHTLGWASYCQGDYAAARRLSEESVTLFRRLGNPGFMAQALTILACEVAALGEEPTAASLLEEALALGKQGEGKEDMARTLCALGRLALRQGELAQARTRYEEGVAMLMEQWRAARFTARATWVLASCLEGLGEIALSQGQAAWTVQLVAAAEALRVAGEYRNPLGMEQPFYERTLTEARTQLGDQTFAALWAEGRTMTPQEALAAEGQSKSSTKRTAVAPVLLTTRSPFGRLTARQVEVLRLVARGLTDKRIAERLTISPRTVNVHVHAIYKKLEITSRSAATRYAVEQHLV